MEMRLGMRGPIPEERMRAICVSLPDPIPLWPQHMPVEPNRARLTHHIREETGKALSALWDGWELLVETYYSLVEAEACKIWYEEFSTPVDHKTAVFFRRYFLDDAALRAYSSCEHMLKCINHQWNLHVSERGKDSLFARVLKALKEKQKEKEPGSPIAQWLDQLKVNKHCEQCVKYRNDWVHHERPNIKGLGPTFRMTERRMDKFVQITRERGEQRSIQELSTTIRETYVALHGTYENILELMASELEPRFGFHIRPSD